MVAGTVVASLVLSLSACSSTATTAPTTNVAPPTVAAPSGAAPSGAATTATAPTSGGTHTPGTVGIVAFDSSSHMDKGFADNANAKLTKDGYHVLMQDPKGDPGQANTICSQYVTAQVEAIAVITFDIDQMAQCMSQAKAANIPVFFEGSPLVAGMAGAIDVTSPAPINDLFIQYLKDNKITDILSLDYSPGTPCRLRAAYRENALAASNAAGTTKVNELIHQFPIPGQVVDSENATAAWLAGHPAGSGEFAIWSCFVDSTAGAVAALNQVGRTDVPVFTWDLGNTIIPEIKSGMVAEDLYLDPIAVGTQVGQLVEDYLNGDTTPKAVLGATVVLNKSNIDAFLAANPDAANS